MKTGIKHHIQCLCVLPQYRKKENPPYHEFVVFSIIDESDTMEEKHAQCNNCGVIHRVIDVCKSEIATNRAEISFLTMDDIKQLKDGMILITTTIYLRRDIVGRPGQHCQQTKNLLHFNGH